MEKERGPLYYDLAAGQKLCYDLAMVVNIRVNTKGPTPQVTQTPPRVEGEEEGRRRHVYNKTLIKTRRDAPQWGIF